MLEQKWLENHEIYYIGAAELPLEFTNGVPLPKGDRDTSSFNMRHPVYTYLIVCLNGITLKTYRFP